MSTKLISKYRGALMGMAVLWIAIHHSYFPFTNKIISFVFDICGYGGVDIFLFLSGFGIYYALKKEPKYWDYMKRRLSRLLPYSMTMCVILFLFGKRTVPEFFIDFFGLSIYLRSNWVWWYTSFALLLYALTPLYFRIFRRKPGPITLCAILLITFACSFLKTYQYVYIYFRAAVYVLGLYFGWVNDHSENTSRICWLSLLAMVFGWAFVYYCYHHFGNSTGYVVPFLFVAPGLCILTAWVFDRLTFLQKPFAFLGTYSYQFYLIHIEVLTELLEHYGEWYRPGIRFDWLINGAGILLGLIASILFKTVVDYCYGFIVRKLKDRKKAA